MSEQNKQEPVGEVLNERGEVDYISYVPPAGTFLYTTPQPQRELNCVCGAVWEGDEMVCVPHKREWVGLTDEERNHARQTITYSQLAMTAGEWTEAVQIETERRLKEKNT